MMCFKDMTFCNETTCRNVACDRKLTRKVQMDARRWWREFNQGGPAPIAASNFSHDCPYYMPRTADIDHTLTCHITIEAVPAEVCGDEFYGCYHRTIEYDVDDVGRRRTIEQYKVYLNPSQGRRCAAVQA